MQHSSNQGGAVTNNDNKLLLSSVCRGFLKTNRHLPPLDRAACSPGGSCWPPWQPNPSCCVSATSVDADASSAVAWLMNIVKCLRFRDKTTIAPQLPAVELASGYSRSEIYTVLISRSQCVRRPIAREFQQLLLQPNIVL